MVTGKLVSQQGFTVPELLVVLAVGALSLTQLDLTVTERDRQRELEAIGNAGIIRVALGRYHTDFEQYPRYLLGGDPAGWTRFHDQYDLSSVDSQAASPNRLVDTLLVHGYLDAYPTNPFVDNGAMVLTASSHDPRFGGGGRRLGNVLDDPSLMGSVTGCYSPGFDLLDLQLERQRAGRKVLPYAHGGRRGQTGTWWPGQFCYRGLQEVYRGRRCYYVPRPAVYESPKATRFLLGVYGPSGTAGEDLIRLEAHDPSGQRLYYRMPYFGYEPSLTRIGWATGLDSDEGQGLPEVSGGGDAWHGPWLIAATRSQQPGFTYYGAPDGVPDGIIQWYRSEQEDMW